MFSFSFSRAAHHFLILPKPWMEITVKITIWVYLQWLRKNKWLIGYQISWIAIARQPEFHRFYALVSTQYLTFSLKDEHDERRKSAKPYTIWAHKGKVLSPIRWTHRKIAKPKTIPRSPQKALKSPKITPRTSPDHSAGICPNQAPNLCVRWQCLSNIFHQNKITMYGLILEGPGLIWGSSGVIRGRSLVICGRFPVILGCSRGDLGMFWGDLV